MHDLESPSSVLDREVVESSNLLGKECCCCGKILAYSFFQRDSSYRDGRRDQCTECARAPRLSTLEHTARLRELNYSSHAVKKQRWSNQEDYENTVARLGAPMHHTDLLLKIRKWVPNIYVTEGRIIGDLAVFQTYPCPQPDLEGRDFRYLFLHPHGAPPGILPIRI